MKKRKVVTIFLAMTLLATSLLGCGGSSDGGSSESNEGETKDTSDAAVEEEIPTLTWYLPGTPENMTSEGYDAVSAELNAYLEEKLGCHLEMKIFSASEYAQKCSTVISAGEPFDLMFTSSWLNNFSANAGSGAYLALDDLLETNAPDAYADLESYVWDACKVGESIYAMPAIQNYAHNDGIFIRADVAEELGIKGSSFENGVDTYTWDELEEIYDKMIEKYGVVPDCSNDTIWGYADQAYELQPLMGHYVPGALRYSDMKTVINQFESEEFMDYCTRMYEWVQKGYVQPDFASYVTKADQIAMDLKSEDNLTYRAGFTAPHVANMAMSECGWEEEPVPIILSNKVIATDGFTSSLTAVGANSRYPELAIQVYNLAYSDPYFVNTMIYGLEGKNYNKISDTEIEILRDSDYYKTVYEWSIANQFITWVEAGVYPADVWENVEAFVEDGTVLDTMGFTFDNSSVATEVANCSAIVEEYKYPLLCGAVDPTETIPTLNSRLEEAGVDKIIEEMQRQLDEFYANK